MRITAVIPARYGSTRFPGKPLVPVAGKPLIQWVWEAAKQSTRIENVLVATDDPRIAETARGFGAEVAMTRADHPSGTDRVAEATRGIKADWLLNLQGDEPLLTGEFLDAWIQSLDSNFGMSTVATPLREPEDRKRPEVVKVRWDRSGKAIS